MNKLIGLSGTNGSGKDTVAEMLAERHGFLFVSVSDLLRNEVRGRKLPVERENLRSISTEWRHKHGLGVLIDKSLELFNKTGAKYKGLVIVSLRNPGEADRVHELGGKVIWVDADPKTRYSRIFSRQRTEEDNKSYEQFIAEEQAEMQHSGDKATLSMSAVRDKADVFLDNSGHDIGTFKNQAEKSLSGLL